MEWILKALMYILFLFISIISISILALGLFIFINTIPLAFICIVLYFINILMIMAWVRDRRKASTHGGGIGGTIWFPRHLNQSDNADATTITI